MARLTDLEATKAIDRLAFVHSRNLDVIGLREWVAAHVGLNPRAAAPLDLDAKLVAADGTLAAANEKLRARKAGIRPRRQGPPRGNPERLKYMRDLMRRKRAKTCEQAAS